ncbi:ribosome biogenesis GTPase [Reichenbachiella faecimaris]|uniref:Small ribosomal subunit biogenesis GTPase RsgA n=1 Tax=Reichenbachiella faecimaris TaxID=692418 RepID=A0A1W2G6U7_REIFA|nr:ribosome small subunit-dependent GTPase A [Reichenbachiella faecimaris]SMD32331.1 ribosome biogenesis GTPase [Reichenbachiella faecimaris]
MTLKDLGYTPALETYSNDQGLDSFEVGRVIAEHRERYAVRTADSIFDAELLGNLRFTAESREDFPAVGDWVALSIYDEDKALIHGIYPRHSIIARQAVGKKGEKQIIATNIDFGLIVQSVNRDFNINRLERYLTICHSAEIEPIIVLSKIDLLETGGLEIALDEIANRIKDVKVVPVSSQTVNGYKKVADIIEKGKTYCLLGSSGVGKSTLLNHLSGRELMETGEISESIDRGKHVTTHRELVVLENGGILIDNPGMREVGIADATGGLEMTFDEILELAEDCKYKDCTHLHEEECAILEALAEGELDQDAYDNYLKMYKEKMHYEASEEDKKRKDKGFGKMMKQVKKARKQNRY